MDTDLSCLVLCPFDNFWAGFVRVRFAWGRCGGPFTRGSDDPMRRCWGGASRAEETGGTGSIRLCWDLSQSGTEPAVSCSTDIFWTQIRRSANRRATWLQARPNENNHLSWLSVGLLINSRISANLVWSHLPRALCIHAWFLKDALCFVHTCLAQCEPVPIVIRPRDSLYLDNIQSFEGNRLDGASI